jgi:hypothetical protein
MNLRAIERGLKRPTGRYQVWAQFMAPMSISRKARRSVLRETGRSLIRSLKRVSYWFRSSIRLSLATGTSAGRTRITTCA